MQNNKTLHECAAIFGQISTTKMWKWYQGGQHITEGYCYNRIPQTHSSPRRMLMDVIGRRVISNQRSFSLMGGTVLWYKKNGKGCVRRPEIGG